MDLIFFELILVVVLGVDVQAARRAKSLGAIEGGGCCWGKGCRSREVGWRLDPP